MTNKLLLLFISLVMAVNTSAYDFEVDGIYYYVTSQNDLTCTVTSNYNKYSGDIVIPSTVTYSGNVFSVTAITDGAFEDCPGLTSIVIPNSVTEIEKNAFCDCPNLKSVQMSNSVTLISKATFSGCTSLKSVELPNSVTLIAKYAFFGCSSLTSVKIPNSVYYIGESAFQGCTSLTSVEIPNSVTEIDYGAFGGCVNIESFTGKFASEDKRCLIVDEVLRAFAPAGLTTYNIPNSVTSIDELALAGCYNLTSFTGKFASADNRCLIVDGVLRAFAPAGLTTYTIPNSVKEISRYVFLDCFSLTSVVIPNSVTEIGYYAFQNCCNLTSVVIGSSVSWIGKWAFGKCSGLKEIISLAVTPPEVGDENTFEDVSKEECVLQVPDESIEVYKSAYDWKEFYNIIGITADISVPSVNDLRNNGKAYNLSGTEVNDGYKGVVIRNGKKALRM